ncbi:MAG: hypothetical protein ACOZHQ_06040 [Thermodesulfobacteriota bacterium]
MLPQIIYVVASLFIAFLGMNRKFGFWGYLFCSLLLTPFVGLIVLLASDRRPRPPVQT